LILCFNFLIFAPDIFMSDFNVKLFSYPNHNVKNLRPLVHISLKNITKIIKLQIIK